MNEVAALGPALIDPGFLAGSLETFAAAAFDKHAALLDKAVRWTNAKAPTRVLWRLAADQAGRSAWASQFSPLAGERLAVAPEPLAVFAAELAHAVTPRARGSLKVHHNRLNKLGRQRDTLWRPCVLAGLQAVASATSASERLALPAPNEEAMA